MTGFEYHSRRVHPALRPYVADLTGYAYPGAPPALHRGLPSQYLTLVITLDEPLGLAWPGSPVNTFETVVGGLHSTAVHISQSPNRSGIQLALRPAAARSLLGLPPGELASMVVELDDILGRSARVVSEQLREAPTWAERFDLVESVCSSTGRTSPRRRRGPSSAGRGGDSARLPGRSAYTILPPRSGGAGGT